MKSAFSSIVSDRQIHKYVFDVDLEIICAQEFDKEYYTLFTLTIISTHTPLKRACIHAFMHAIAF